MPVLEQTAPCVYVCVRVIVCACVPMYVRVCVLVCECVSAHVRGCRHQTLLHGGCVVLAEYSCDRKYNATKQLRAS